MTTGLLMVFIALSLAFIVSNIIHKMGLPRVIGYLIAGIMLSAIVKFLPMSWDQTFFSQLADLGIIMLFYFIGLEFDVMPMFRKPGLAVSVSLVNTLLPFIGGFLIMRYLFGLEVLSSVVIAVCMSMSAQSVSVDILEESRKLKSKVGKLIIGIGAVDDLIEMVFVTFLLSWFHVGAENTSLIVFVMQMAAFILVLFFARVWLIPQLLSTFELEHSSTARFSASIIILLLIASLAEVLHISAVLAALFAGILVSQTIIKEERLPNSETKDISRSIHILAFGFLIPLFFVQVGLKSNVFDIVGQNGVLSVMLPILATIGTVGGSMLVLRLSGHKPLESSVISWGLNPKGDFELVLATLALELGIISQGLFTAVIVMSLATTIVSPIVFKRLLSRYRVSS